MIKNNEVKPSTESSLKRHDRLPVKPARKADDQSRRIPAVILPKKDLDGMRQTGAISYVRKQRNQERPLVRAEDDDDKPQSKVYRYRTPQNSADARAALDSFLASDNDEENVAGGFIQSPGPYYVDGDDHSDSSGDDDEDDDFFYNEEGHRTTMHAMSFKSKVSGLELAKIMPVSDRDSNLRSNPSSIDGTTAVDPPLRQKLISEKANYQKTGVGNNGDDMNNKLQFSADNIFSKKTKPMFQKKESMDTKTPKQEIRTSAIAKKSSEESENALHQPVIVETEKETVQNEIVTENAESFRSQYTAQPQDAITKSKKDMHKIMVMVNEPPISHNIHPFPIDGDSTSGTMVDDEVSSVGNPPAKRPDEYLTIKTLSLPDGQFPAVGMDVPDGYVSINSDGVRKDHNSANDASSIFTREKNGVVYFNSDDKNDGNPRRMRDRQGSFQHFDPPLLPQPPKAELVAVTAQEPRLGHNRGYVPTPIKSVDYDAFYEDSEEDDKCNGFIPSQNQLLPHPVPQPMKLIPRNSYSVHIRPGAFCDNAERGNENSLSATASQREPVPSSSGKARRSSSVFEGCGGSSPSPVLSKEVHAVLVAAERRARDELEGDQQRREKKIKKKEKKKKERSQLTSSSHGEVVAGEGWQIHDAPITATKKSKRKKKKKNGEAELITH
mmetsp:Transcript_42938/g.100795  ORF Transcript_42938/g.100795 Transcript_42938/m.100795 type:complete len:667 (+) Transcript_42938:734-2734(+)